MSDKKTIEVIKGYPMMSQLIHDREIQIMYPFSPDVDENIGGGRAKNKKDDSQERMALRLASDNELNKLHKREDAVCKVLYQCATNKEPRRLDDTTYMIIDEMYLKERRELTIDGIANKVHTSRRNVFNRRDAFVNAVKKELK